MQLVVLLDDNGSQPKSTSSLALRNSQSVFDCISHISRSRLSQRLQKLSNFIKVKSSKALILTIAIQSGTPQIQALHDQYPILVYLYLQFEFPWSQAYLVQKGHNLPQVSFPSNIGCPTPHVVFVNTIEGVVKTPMHDLINKSTGFNVVQMLYKSESLINNPSLVKVLIYKRLVI